jgi:3-oxoacyl-(acyl-carrier-protein) synthase
MSADLSERRVVIAGMGVISSSGKDLVTLQTDDADVVAARGAEEMAGLVHVGFCRLRAMTERGGDPKQAARPGRFRCGMRLNSTQGLAGATPA